VSMGITERDLSVLCWAGEQYALPMELVGRIVSGSRPLVDADRVARRSVARLELLGYAGRRALLGRQWVTPTGAGLRAAALPYRAIVPREGLLEHVAAVARLRLQLQRRYPEARWESERAIRVRRAGTSFRRPDGGLWWDNGASAALEVELHVKEVPRYAGIVRDADPGWAGVWWYTPARLVPLLLRRLEQADAGDRHRVYPLEGEL
jgi:hypothetical protein